MAVSCGLKVGTPRGLKYLEWTALHADKGAVLLGGRAVRGVSFLPADGQGTSAEFLK